ncbi:MAG: hypothetical protein WCR36_06235 [Bacteroidaceae bacterium]
MEKINLTDFQVSSIKVEEMLLVMGGSGEHNNTGTSGCLTNTQGSDGDRKSCDTDVD